MKAFPQTPEFQRLAARVIWFEDASTALSDPVRFMAYAMRQATSEDMAVLLVHVGEEGLREAIDHAPPGIIDERSWAYWNGKIGRYPTPPAPRREL